MSWRQTKKRKKRQGRFEKSLEVATVDAAVYDTDAIVFAEERHGIFTVDHVEWKTGFVRVFRKAVFRDQLLLNLANVIRHPDARFPSCLGADCVPNEKRRHENQNGDRSRQCCCRNQTDRACAKGNHGQAFDDPFHDFRRERLVESEMEKAECKQTRCDPQNNWSSHEILQTSISCGIDVAEEYCTT